MRLSVVIPALDEEGIIGRTVRAVKERAAFEPEIVVADGGSSDATAEEARQAGAGLVLEAPRGRARQMNAGADAARGEILYFLHADTLPPEGFDRLILDSVSGGRPAGSFRLSFRPSHPLLDAYAWFTRFDVNAFRFGDQSLYVTKKLFARSGGFREDHMVMEDNEMVRRLKGMAPFALLDRAVITSSRKYRRNGVLRLQLVFTWIWVCYHLGIPQRQLVAWYREWVR